MTFNRNLAMGHSDRTCFLLGVLAANIGLFFMLTDCRKDFFPDEVDSLLLLLALAGIMLIGYGYMAFHRSWNYGTDDETRKKRQAILLRLQCCTEGTLFLYPASIVMARLLDVEFDSSPMTVGIVGMAGGVGLMVLGHFLFRGGKGLSSTRNASRPKE